MEMPTPCAHCSKTFDLNDGVTSPKRYPNIILCEPCGTAERAEVERDEEIERLNEEIEDAEYTIKSAKERLAELQVR